MNEQLQQLCGDKFRPWIATPFSFELSGSWWNAATDGHGLICIREGEGELKREDSPPVKGLFNAKPHTHIVAFPELMKWLAECSLATRCDACDGEGEHDCNCEHCEYDGECEACDGNGELPNVSPFVFENLQLDRAILARFLDPVADYVGPVMLFTAGELDPIEFRSADWRVVIMPRKPGTKDNCPAMPDGLIRKVD